jgi:hypothetical protein
MKLGAVAIGASWKTDVRAMSRRFLIGMNARGSGTRFITQEPCAETCDHHKTYERKCCDTKPMIRTFPRLGFSFHSITLL